MAVKIRFRRMGRKNHPFYRLNAIDSRSPRDGRVIEELGYYDPGLKDQTKQFCCKARSVQVLAGYRRDSVAYGFVAFEKERAGA